MFFLFCLFFVLTVGKIYRPQNCPDLGWRQVSLMLLCRHFLLYKHFLWVLYKMDVWDKSRDLVLCGVFQQKYLLFSSMDDQFTALHENPDMWVFCLVTHLMILSPFTLHDSHDIMCDSTQNHRYPWSSNACNPRDEPEVAKCGVRGVWWGRQVRNEIRHLKASLFNSNIGLINVCAWLRRCSSPLCRLFEMGFAEQLQEIIRRLPETRQTLLFSATLPKLLVEFARAGEIHSRQFWC